jgi:alkyl sulfatase BDS1-like metallo-beta-lactamase superfamily hydrolase
LTFCCPLPHQKRYLTQEIGEFPVKAAVYSHTHADHFGGVKGVVSQEQVDSGAVQIIAPKDFMEHAIKENDGRLYLLV